MKIISAQDMAALKDARGVLEAVKGDALGDVDALIEGCKVGEVEDVVGLMLVKIDTGSDDVLVKRCPSSVEVRVRNVPNGNVDGSFTEVWRGAKGGRPRKVRDFSA